LSPKPCPASFEPCDEQGSPDLVANLLHLVGCEPSNHRGPGGGIKGIELIVDPLNRLSSFLMLLTQRHSGGCQDDRGCR